MTSIICPPGQHSETHGTICVADDPPPPCPYGMHAVPNEVCVPDPVIEPVWEDLGAVPGASDPDQTPSDIGKRISQLHPHGGHVYAGYGEWTTTSQKGCDVVRWSEAAGHESLIHVATDALWSYRTVNGACWALVTDPEVGCDPDAVIVGADGSIRTLVGSRSPYPYHLFDAIFWRGKTYVCGGLRTQAKDGVVNASWGTVWREDPATSGPPIWTATMTVKSTYRVHALFAIGDRLWAIDGRGVGHWTMDGSTWTEVPRSTLTFRPTPSKPQALGDAVVLRSGWPAFGVGDLWVFDGSRTSVLRPRVRDHHVDGAILWTLESGSVYQDGAPYCPAPDGAVSLAVLDGWLYVGTADGHLWRRVLA